MMRTMPIKTCLQCQKPKKMKPRAKFCPKCAKKRNIENTRIANREWNTFKYCHICGIGFDGSGEQLCPKCKATHIPKMCSCCGVREADAGYFLCTPCWKTDGSPTDYSNKERYKNYVKSEVDYDDLPF